jgi:pectin methylesterase-like acyl-CoA thioesterase
MSHSRLTLSITLLLASVPLSAQNGTSVLRVSADGVFKTVQSALDAAPANGALILVAPGTYRELITVSKPNIRLRGAGTDPSQTVIVFDRAHSTVGTTIGSATVTVTADNFFAENITFQNDFNRTHTQEREGSQAVALATRGDRGIYTNVRLLANQDTVFAGSRNCSTDGPNCVLTRQYFSHCTIAGNVDFIFGDGKVVFDDCEIRSTPYYDAAFIAAQSKHYPEQDSGFVFNHCRLVADAGITFPVYLGRPWRDYAYTVYLNTWMGAHIDAAGWSEWLPDTHKLETAYYAEYNSTGPGAPSGHRNPQVHILTAREAKQYETATFLRGADNWEPEASLKQLLVDNRNAN